MTLREEVAANPRLAKIKAADKALFDKICNQGGCLTAADLERFVKVDPQRLLLVRCNGGRFLAPADQTNHFCNLIRDYGTLLEVKFGKDTKGWQAALDAGYESIDWVRDVSIPA